MCTLVTKGQVASNTLSERRLASCCTTRGTPCALKITVALSGHLVQFLDEYRADRAQAIDHIFVVHHFMPHIDGFAKQRDRPLDDIDGAVDAGAESARISQ